eukprot:3904760-Rhodomonas_salina.3
MCCVQSTVRQGPAKDTHNGIGNAGGGPVLSECKALSHLALSYNCICAEGAGRLEEVLRECKLLAHLDLSCNGIGDEGAGRLAEVLGESKALAHLALGDNEIGAEGAGRRCEGSARLWLILP